MREGGSYARGPRRPAWLQKNRNVTPAVLAMERRAGSLRLHTVCQSARCPNLAECFSAGTATFLILGDSCTRECAFCAVDHGGRVSPPDREEGRRIAAFMRSGGIRYAVITSVTRDDLEDGGAAHFARVVRDVKTELPSSRVEVLVPDFGGSPEAVGRVCQAPVDVFGHNMETVRRLYPAVRPAASYERSLGVLETAKHAWGLVTKTGIMVGVGEREEELESAFRDCARSGVDILTIGQYLRPSGENLPVERYYAPQEFEALRALALEAGIPVVVAGPYVRSSYLAENGYREVRAGRDECAAFGGEKDV